MQQRFQPYTRLAAIILLVIGCLTVLRPFLAAILFAAAITISSWPLYQRLLTRLKQRRTIAALVMSIGLTLLIIVPLTLVTWNIADNASDFYEQLKASVGTGTLEPPAWLKDIPVVGEAIYTFPHALMILLSALSLADARLFDAASSMGASPAKAFRSITWPATRQAVFAAFCLVFTLTITDFGVPVVVGGDYQVLALEAYKAVVGQQQFGRGALIGMVLLLPALFSFTVVGLPLLLEYEVDFSSTGEFEVQLLLAPTLNFNSNKGLRYEISFDNEKAQIINFNGNYRGELGQWQSEHIIKSKTKHQISKSKTA